jgi:hypothetical protein
MVSGLVTTGCGLSVPAVRRAKASIDGDVGRRPTLGRRPAGSRCAVTVMIRLTVARLAGFVGSLSAQRSRSDIGIAWLVYPGETSQRGLGGYAHRQRSERLVPAHRSLFSVPEVPVWQCGSSA